MDSKPGPIIGFLGCGKLGTAILQGLLRDPTAASRILISVQTEESAHRIRTLILTTQTIPTEVFVGQNTKVARHAAVIFLACKSSQPGKVLTSDLVSVLENKVILSTLGGISSASLRAYFPPSAHCIIVRAIPSVAAAVGASTTLVEHCPDLSQTAAIESLLGVLGPVRIVPEQLMEAGVVATASSPAFFTVLLEAVASGLSAHGGFGVEEGLACAVGAMKSAAALVEAGMHPRDVVQRIATTGGSTQAGLGTLREMKVAEAMESAVERTLRAAEKLGGNGVPWKQTVQRASTMDAVVFQGVRRVAVEKRPVPNLSDAGDVIVRVKYSGLCGSDLHIYRGKESCGAGFVLGHEFTGTVVEVGAGVRSFKPGDLIVCPFTTSCARCFFCRNGTSSRCKAGQVFGTPTLDGAQAEYVRVPLADASAVKAPREINPRNLILMADIFPTGYFAARNAFNRLSVAQRMDATVSVIGCGPVGLCALVTALTYSPKHVLAIDPTQERREAAAKLGASAWSGQSDRAELEEKIKQLSDGRGVDIVLEAVGSSSALQLAFDIVRPGGAITSVGVHSGNFPFTAAQAYDKNIHLQIGRCPVSSIFSSALQCFKENEKKLEFLTRAIVPLSRAPEYYEAYDQMKVQKVIFDAEMGQPSRGRL